MDFQNIVEEYYSSEDVYDITEKFDLDNVYYGNDRIVFELDDENVLKVAREEGSTRQNRFEIKNWDIKQLRPFLAELRDWGNNYRWVLMQNCDRASKGDSKIIYDKMNSEGFYPMDPHYRNVGILPDGITPVLIDYGHRIEIRD